VFLAIPAADRRTKADDCKWVKRRTAKLLEDRAKTRGATSGDLR
jgi:hypothetical protein